MRYELRVNRSDLIEGLKKLEKLVKRKNISEAFLGLENGMFVISLDGTSIESSADGEFPGSVRIPGVKALTLSKVLPSDDPLTIAHDQHRLYIGTFSMPCVWQGEQNLFQVPPDAPITHLLGLRRKHTSEEISKSGLSSAVERAEATRGKLERQAAFILEPLGVSLSDVRSLVESCLNPSSGTCSSEDNSRRPTFEELAAQALESHRMLHAAGKCREGSEQHERFMKKMAKWM